MSGQRLILLRHGRTGWNDDGRAQGHADVELDAVGQEQAAAAAPYLSSLDPAALWSSDLRRARQTCVPLEKATGRSAKYDARLREFDVGARQGMTFAEFEQSFPAEFASWVRGDDTARVPGAEVAADVEKRVVPALREALDSLRDGETGILVDPADAHAVIATVRLLLEDQELGRRLGLGGRKAVEAYFNWDRVTADVRRIGEELA